MIQIYAKHNQLEVREKEPFTSGTVNACRVCFQFSEDWDGLGRTAVFRAGDTVREVLLDSSGECVIPWEVLREPGRLVYAGVYGSGARAAEPDAAEDQSPAQPAVETGAEPDPAQAVALPTIWAYLGTVLAGAVPGEAAQPANPSLYEQLAGQVAGKADRLAYTDEGELGLYAGKTLLGAVPVRQEGDDPSAADHRMLTHRESPDQHSIEAITGLKEALAGIPEAAQILTDTELEALLQ